MVATKLPLTPEHWKKIEALLPSGDRAREYFRSVGLQLFTGIRTIFARAENGDFRY
jgi:hypothetical protein